MFVFVAENYPTASLTRRLQLARLYCGLGADADSMTAFAWADDIVDSGHDLVELIRAELRRAHEEYRQVPQATDHQEFLARSSERAVARMFEKALEPPPRPRVDAPRPHTPRQRLKTYLIHAHPSPILPPKEQEVEVTLILLVRRLNLTQFVTSLSIVLTGVAAMITNNTLAALLAGVSLVVLRVGLGTRMAEVEAAIESVREFPNPTVPKPGDYVSLQLFRGPVTQIGRFVGKVLTFSDGSGTAEIVSEPTPRKHRLQTGARIELGDTVRFNLTGGMATIG